MVWYKVLFESEYHCMAVTLSVCVCLCVRTRVKGSTEHSSRTVVVFGTPFCADRGGLITQSLGCYTACASAVQFEVASHHCVRNIGSDTNAAFGIQVQLFSLELLRSTRRTRRNNVANRRLHASSARTDDAGTSCTTRPGSLYSRTAVGERNSIR